MTKGGEKRSKEREQVDATNKENNGMDKRVKTSFILATKNQRANPPRLLWQQVDRLLQKQAFWLAQKGMKSQMSWRALPSFLPSV